MQRGYLVQEPMLKPMYPLSPMHFGVYPVVLDGFAQFGSAQADPTIMARKMRRAGRGARRWNASIIICERRAATQRSGQLRITMPERVARAQPQAAASRWLADSIRSNAAAQQTRAQAGDRRRCAAKHDRSERRFAERNLYLETASVRGINEKYILASVRGISSRKSVSSRSPVVDELHPSTPFA